jgi:hypothetical protein
MKEAKRHVKIGPEENKTQSISISKHIDKSSSINKD